MGSPLYSLIKELEKITVRMQNSMETKIFMIACIFISFLKLFNIITIYQYVCLFSFYIIWLNCSILYNVSIYNKIEKKISKND